MAEPSPYRAMHEGEHGDEMRYRLIDAYALLERIPKARFDGEKIDRSGAIADTIMLICTAPAIDAVEVVRCKDCVHAVNGAYPDGLLWCKKLGQAQLEYDYCSDGRRKNHES